MNFMLNFVVSKIYTMENQKAYIITGPTSGIGYETALELAKHGTVVLVGRNREKLEQVQKTKKNNGYNAVSVICDISDMTSVRHAAQQIIDLGLPIVGLRGLCRQKPQKASRALI